MADGMGGHASGETASQLAVSNIEDFITRSRSSDIKWKPSENQDLTLEQNRLLAAVSFANNRIRKVAANNPEMNGMGTTLVGVLMETDDHFAVVNIGDSRLYRIREGEIKQITKIINDSNDIVSNIATSVEQQSATTKEIATNVSQAARGIQEININVSHSLTASEDIAKNISSVNQNAGSISDSSSQVKINTEDLSGLADKLQTQVDTFKVINTPALNGA